MPARSKSQNPGTTSTTQAFKGKSSEITGAKSQSAYVRVAPRNRNAKTRRCERIPEAFLRFKKRIKNFGLVKQVFRKGRYGLRFDGAQLTD